jgi:lysyl-tRNA synthetase class 2
MEAAWWHAARHKDRAPFLRARTAILRAVRAWFECQGFTEVDAGALVSSPGAEIHTAALQTSAGYLHTSPEFAMKKLLAAGETKIFFLGKVYRAGETGPLHAPEFTMLEWYRANAGYEAIMDDSIAIARLAATANDTPNLRWRDQSCDPFQRPQRLTVQAAFRAFTAAAPPTDPDNFAASLVTQIEPRLGQDALTLLHEYPLSEAALARHSPKDPSVAERFELYACGVELANGFGELTDPAEQRRRFEIEMDVKAARYGERYPIDEDFLTALAHMPQASGVALGFDRLVLLASGARRIEDVQWTPWP